MVLLLSLFYVSDNGVLSIDFRESEGFTNKETEGGEYINGDQSFFGKGTETQLNLHPKNVSHTIFGNQSISRSTSSSMNWKDFSIEKKEQLGIFSSIESVFSDATSFDNHTYLFFSTYLTWEEARIYCESLGGYLVTITSQDENDFVRLLSNVYNPPFSIGFSDEVTEGEWQWVTGEAVIYTNWGDGEPNDSGGEDYAETDVFGEWNDAPREQTRYFVCEWDYLYPYNSTIDPFIIENNTNFEEVAAINNWSGNGTEISPYIIENHTFYGYFNDSSILIRNTNIHFIIRNCTFIGGPGGVLLSNVTNGQIRESKFFNSLNGLRLQKSSNCRIINNSFTTVSERAGILLNGSQNNLILNNSLKNSGLVLLWSRNNTCSYNEFTNLGLSIYSWNEEDYFQAEVAGNSVKDLPIIFWQNKLNQTVPTEAGQIILVNCSYIEIKNQKISTAREQIFITFSKFVDIRNNTLTNASGYFALGIHTSKNTTIYNNTVNNNAGWGIYVRTSEENLILNNSVKSNGWNGIFVDNSTYMNISGNNCYDNEQNGILLINTSLSDIISNNCSQNEGSGIHFLDSQRTNLIGNAVFLNNDNGLSIENTNSCTFTFNSVFENQNEGILLSNSINDIFSNNTIYNNEGSGFYTYDSSGMIISNNNIFLNDVGGMDLAYSSETNLLNNQIEDNYDHGIRISDSNNNLILKNSIINSTYSSFQLYSSNNNTIQENTISEADEGILLYNSFDCIITNNVITFIESSVGIGLESSEKNIISRNQLGDTTLLLSWSGKNSLLNNSFDNLGITIYGGTLEHYLQTEVVNNFLDGNPIIFWQNETNKVVSSESSQILLVNCVRIEVSNLTIPSTSGDGIVAAFCENIIVRDNVITTEYYAAKYGHNGINFYRTNNSIIRNNYVAHHFGGVGILITGAKNNIIIENTVHNNKVLGVFVGNSENITISENEIKNN
ncbi:MAG: right-handed parallel beta-helix repeat-containing protein, partial [Candidatus Hodarchaeales archaeon]